MVMWISKTDKKDIKNRVFGLVKSKKFANKTNKMFTTWDVVKKLYPKNKYYSDEWGRYYERVAHHLKKLVEEGTLKVTEERSDYYLKPKKIYEVI
jgi:hypothetical protein